MLIEEAYWLANISDETSAEHANTKGQAAEAFAQCPGGDAEHGEGIIIAETIADQVGPAMSLATRA